MCDTFALKIDGIARAYCSVRSCGPAICAGATLTGAAFEVDDSSVFSLRLEKREVLDSEQEGMDVIVSWGCEVDPTSRTEERESQI